MLIIYLITYLFLRGLKKKNVVPKCLFLSQARLSYLFPSQFCHSAPPYLSPYPMPKGLCRSWWEGVIVTAIFRNSIGSWYDEAEMLWHGSCKVRNILSIWDEGSTTRLLEPRSAIEFSYSCFNSPWQGLGYSYPQGPAIACHHVVPRNQHCLKGISIAVEWASRLSL